MALELVPSLDARLAAALDDDAPETISGTRVITGAPARVLSREQTPTIPAAAFAARLQGSRRELRLVYGLGETRTAAIRDLWSRLCLLRQDTTDAIALARKETKQ